jgi:tetratricopeptide (TPR) repeat protein
MEDTRSDLSFASLAAFMRRAGESKASGRLLVRCGESARMIEFADGRIDGLGRAGRRNFRLGDILIARGDLTDGQINEALRRQKLDGTRLGETLSAMGLVSDKKIAQLLRFQVMEELADVFTWPSGSFEFNPGQETETEPDLRVDIDPAEVVQQAEERRPQWDLIEAKIPSPNAVFALTVNGELMIETAGASSRRLLEFVRDHDTVEMMIKKAFLGRFMICKALVDLMDAQMVEIVPHKGLYVVAEQLEAQKAWERALGVYRRMVEVAQNPQDKVEINRRIAAVEANLAIVRDTHSREASLSEREPVLKKKPDDPKPGSAAAVADSSKTPAARTPAARLRAAVLSAALFIVLAAGAVFLLRSRKPEWLPGFLQPPALPANDAGDAERAAADAAARDAASRAKSENDNRRIAEVAVRITDIAARLTNEPPDGPLLSLAELEASPDLPPQAAGMVRKEIKRIRDAIARVDEEFGRAKALEENGQLDAAFAAYGNLVNGAEWSALPAVIQAHRRRESIDARTAYADLQLDAGRRAKRHGQFEEAFDKFDELVRARDLRGLASVASAREEADGLRKKVADIRSYVADAEALEKSGRVMESCQTLLKLVSQYPGTRSALQARLPLSVYSLPPGAEVLKNGVRAGLTPLVLRVGVEEKFKLSFRLDGHPPAEHEFPHCRQAAFTQDWTAKVPPPDAPK